MFNNTSHYKEVLMINCYFRFLSFFAIAGAMQFAVATAKAEVPLSQFSEAVSIGLSVDTTYQYVFNCDNETVSNCPAERGLYDEHNNFSIDAFTLSVEKEANASGASLADKVGFRADILFGEQAERLGFGFNSDGDGAVSPYQAYLKITPTEELSIVAGQFTTLAGWELIEAKNNTNVSRSLLFYRIPFAHSGVRAAYSAGPLDLTFGLSNDWDAVDEVDDGKTFEFQAAYSHSSDAGFINDLWLGATVYVGKSEFGEIQVDSNNSGNISIFDIGTGVESLTPLLPLLDDDNKTRTLLTLVGSVTSGRLTFVGDLEFTWVEDGRLVPVRNLVDIGNDNNPSNDEVRQTGVRYDSFFRWGVGGYAIYQAASDLNLSLRAEYVDDSETSDSVKLFEITPTVAWKPFGESGKGVFETRFEYRWDRADVEYFPSDSGLKKDQHALLLQLLYWI